MKKILYAGLVAGLCFLFAGSIWAAEKGLVGHWKFDEGKGNIAKDSSGKGNDGKINEARWAESGLEFDGKDDYVDCGNDASLNITDAITVEAWVYSADFGQDGMVVMKNPVNAIWMLLFERDLLIWRVNHGGGAADLTTPAPTNNTWHHIAATQSGTSANLYLDGVLKLSATEDSIPSSSGTINIGRFDSGYYFNGIIDEVRIYNRALTAQEIKNHYETGHIGMDV